ncbi:RluA family pseudouridine synthase [Roseateles sp.]|jgi:tRNA pseudouridine32 synthase/23S rRNA pseudouridine746 synthase|uniref:RluA family pseudouridine synthase n=1 Tax=Roseateles sp. TaxID=1971397 RepID=UPI0037C94799
MPPPYPELPPVYVDERLIVVDKPADLLTVPGRGEDKQDCAIHRVQQRFNDALIVHRLDMATSGLLLLARGAEMQRSLSIAFAQRRVAKRYTAVLAGCLAEACGEVDLPLMPDWPNRPRQKVDLAHGKPSLTRWQVLARDEQAQSTRVALEPVTGRSHQLRLHMQAIGHPILGDPLYASPAQCALAPRLLLHASWLHLPELGLSFDSAAPF